MKTYSSSAGAGAKLIEKDAPAKTISMVELFSSNQLPSATIFAFLIFTILNIFSLLTWSPADNSLSKLRQRVFNSPSESTLSGSWPWWIARAYLSSKTPNIAIIGDSQINAAFFQTDAAVVGNPVDCAVDRSCPALKAALEQRTPQLAQDDLHLINLALGGAMPSDFYMISKALLTEKEHPKLVILALSPRSFLDSTLTSASSTEIFQFFSPFVKLGNLIDYSFSNPAQKYLWLVKNRLPLFACKPDIDSFADQLLEQCLTRIGITKVSPLIDQNQSIKPHPIQSIYAGDGAVAKGTNMIGPFPFSNFLDNRREYVRRFSRLNQQTYNDQHVYFQSTLKYLRQLGIEVIVVNMPVLKPVRDLLPSRVQQNYLLDLKTTCSANHVSLLNLATSTEFPKRYFIDYVHLNAGGGKVLINQLADFITSNKLGH